jgi:hypothetical protein
MPDVAVFLYLREGYPIGKKRVGILNLSGFEIQNRFRNGDFCRGTAGGNGLLHTSGGGEYFFRFH